MKHVKLSCSECLEYCGAEDKQIAVAALAGLLKRALTTAEISLDEVAQVWAKRDIKANVSGDIVLNKRMFFEQLLPLVGLNPQMIADWVHNAWPLLEKRAYCLSEEPGNSAILRGYLALGVELVKAMSSADDAKSEKTWLHEMILASRYETMIDYVMELSYRDITLCDVAKELKQKQKVYVMPDSVVYAFVRLTDQQVEEYGEKYLEAMEKLCVGMQRSLFNFWIWQRYMKLAKRCLEVPDNKAESVMDKIYNKMCWYFIRQYGCEKQIVQVMDDVVRYFGYQRAIEFVRKVIDSHSRSYVAYEVRRDVAVYGLMVRYLLRSLPENCISSNKMLNLLSLLSDLECPSYLVAEGYDMLLAKKGITFDEQLLQRIIAGDREVRKVLMAFVSFNLRQGGKYIGNLPIVALALLLISKKPTNNVEYQLARKMLDIVLSKYWCDVELLNLSEAMWQKIVAPTRRDTDLDEVLITLVKAKLVPPEFVLVIGRKSSVDFTSPQWREVAPELALNTQERLKRQDLLRQLAE